MTRVLKEKYFPSGCVLDAKPNLSASWLWNSWVKVLSIYKKDIRRTVRDGLNTKILAHPWVIDLPTGIHALKSEVSSLQLTWVKELMYVDGRSWNRSLIQSLFTDESCNAILKMKDLNPAENDRWVWSADTKGKFTKLTILQFPKPVYNYQRTFYGGFGNRETYGCSKSYGCLRL
ncbi:RNA-directed DNA polymerase [Striga asiatica]|uniref:RNA-directed DNA polymerase n=1 Tax=Striga asiatica TaxID=4170 RepID=A0A5A7PC67_STRAF|nr:RNA-directed DNA polymerase [Striga asiatica]